MSSTTRNPFEKVFLDFLKLWLLKVLGGVGPLFQKGHDPPEAKVPVNYVLQ
jgi:hypothetical protein